MGQGHKRHTLEEHGNGVWQWGGNGVENTGVFKLEIKRERKRKKAWRQIAENKIMEETWLISHVIIMEHMPQSRPLSCIFIPAARETKSERKRKKNHQVSV